MLWIFCVSITLAQNILTSYNSPCFIKNKGQWHQNALFQTRIEKNNIWFTNDAIIYDLFDLQADINKKNVGHVFKQKFINSQKFKTISDNILPGTFNFIKGNSIPSRTADVPAFKEIVQQDIYTGVYIKYYFNSNEFKYDIVVLPGNDPNVVKYYFEGIVGLPTLRYNNKLLKDELVIKTSVGEVVENIPVCYQNINGNKVVVNAKFKLSNDTISFSIGSYNTNEPLIIDPSVSLNTYLGGAGDEFGRSLDVDTSGNIYVTGLTRSTEFPITLGAYDITLNSANGTYDIFVTKFNRSASSIIYSTLIGGSSVDESTGIKVSQDGTAIVCGATSSIDFPRVNNSQIKKNGLDGIVFGLDPTGSSLKFSTFLGGDFDDKIEDIILDNKDTIYLVGSTNSNNFPISLNVLQSTYMGGEDGFITKLNPNGNSISSSTFLGGNNNDKAISICFAFNGDVCVTGKTESSNFPTKNGYRLTPIAGEDCYLVRLNRQLNVVNYGTYFGGANQEEPSSICADSLNNIFISGWTNSSDFPNLPASGIGNWFLIKFNSLVGIPSLEYSRMVGNINSALTTTMKCNSLGNSFVCGSGPDLKFIEFDPKGNFLPAISIDGTNIDEVAKGSYLSKYNDFYICGTTNSANLLQTSNAYDNILNLNSSSFNFDAFVIRFSFKNRPFAVFPNSRDLDTLICDTVRYDTIYIFNQGDSDLVIGRPYFLPDDGFYKIVFPPSSGTYLVAAKSTPLKIIVQFSTRINANKVSELVFLTNEEKPYKYNKIKYSAVRISPTIEFNNISVKFPKTTYCDSPIINDTTINVKNNGDDLVSIIGIRMSSGKNYIVNSKYNFPLVVNKQISIPINIKRNITSANTYKDTLIVDLKECNGEIKIPIESDIDSISFQALSGDTIRYKPLDVCNGVISDTQQINLINNGNIPVKIDSVFISNKSFKLIEKLPFMLFPGKVLNLNLVYSYNGSNAPIIGNINFLSNPCGFELKVNIFSEGIKSPVNPPILNVDYGKFYFCSNDKFVDSVLVFKNISNVIVNILPSQVQTHFQIIEPVNFPYVVKPGDEMKIKIRYQPKITGNILGVFKFPFYSGTCDDTLIVTTQGESISPSISTNEPFDVGEIETCKTSLDTFFIVKNNYETAFKIDSLKSINGNIREEKFPIIVPILDSVLVKIHFTPLTTDEISDTVLLFISYPCIDVKKVAIKAKKFGNVVMIDNNEIKFPPLINCNILQFPEVLLKIKNSSQSGLGNIISVKSVKINGSQIFKIYPDIIGKSLKINDTLNIIARMEPTMSGLFNAEAEIVFSPCNDTIIIKMIGTVDEPILPFAELPIFQPISIGDTGKTSVLIFNTTNAEVRVDSLSSILKPFRIISVIPSLPIIIKNRESFRINYEFVPEIIGNASVVNKVFYSEPCNFTNDIRLTGEGYIRKENIFMCINGKYGSNVGDTLEVKIVNQTPRKLLNKTTAEIYLSYSKNSLLLLPFKSSDTIINDSKNGSKIKINNIDELNYETLKLKFITLGSNIINPIIKIDSIKFSDTTLIPIFCQDSATIQVNNRCYLNGTHLGYGKNFLLKPNPNPASSDIVIKFGQLEDVETTIKIVDVNGKEVYTPLNNKFNRSGEYTLKFTSNDLPNGKYFIILLAGQFNALETLHISR